MLVELPEAILYSLVLIVPPELWRSGLAPEGASKLAIFYSPVMFSVH